MIMSEKEEYDQVKQKSNEKYFKNHSKSTKNKALDNKRKYFSLL
jgi:hypothetical protein